ncbi:hypothetical protein OGAPHI_006446 [Ogataea philodendri]|uniref:Calcineurin-like phosphoesterase domain-containing protein n=1 Tax=Ogataea philodendri TaxID=1378263 RepID=A0A9P8NWJ4_9ASCO|nr:uncharacterized protein OGAPHI_006446 [Ogataea philodendri]KAH3661598.1 hypothetical protein OGAPHI_006446 [Ogataea philodendri]
MVSETTPLQDEYEYDEEDIHPFELMLKKTVSKKPVIWGLSLLIGGPLIYFLLVFLPNLAPPAADIPDLTMVSSPSVYLHPLIPPKAHRSEIEQQLKDPESPVKIVPDFEKWELLDSSSKLFKKHFDKSDIDESLKPVKRIILIGDVHGSLFELQKLLKKIGYDGGHRDQIFLVGDFLAKGKNSIGVLDYVIQNRIGCVIGNHEWEVLKRYAQFHGLPALTVNGTTTPDYHASEQYDLDDLMRIAKHLTPEHIEYLAQCPIIQELGPVPRLTNKKQTKYAPVPADGVAVHGGLVWNIEDLEDQDPESVLTMRNLLPPDWVIPTDNRHDSVDGVKSKAWSKFWTKYQREVVANNTDEDPFTLGTKVYYGHDAKRGLVAKEFSTGLDSGCVYGAQLSAEIIWSEVIQGKSKDAIVYKRMLSQVNC